MDKSYFILANAVLTLTLMLGCSETTNPSTGSNDNAPSKTLDGNAGTVKIVVLTDGTVYVDSETVAIDSLSSKLDELGEIKEIWYHREAPDDAEPHENAMRAISEIAGRGLPIAMYLDREFTQRLTMGD